MSDSNREKLYQEEVLRTLSYFEPMDLEKIFLDFDREFLLSHPDFVVEDLARILMELKNKRLVKEVGGEEQKQWMRIFPEKKPWWKKLSPF